MAEQRDVQALAETVREGLSKVQALDGQVCRCPSCVNAAERLAALDELVLEHTRQEAVVEAAAALDDAYTYDGEASYSLHEALHIALAVLSPPPVASEDERKQAWREWFARHEGHTVYGKCISHPMGCDLRCLDDRPGVWGGGWPDLLSASTSPQSGDRRRRGVQELGGETADGVVVPSGEEALASVGTPPDNLTATYWGYIVTDEECRVRYLDMCERMDVPPGHLSPSAILINPEPLSPEVLEGLRQKMGMSSAPQDDPA